MLKSCSDLFVMQICILAVLVNRTGYLPDLCSRYDSKNNKKASSFISINCAFFESFFLSHGISLQKDLKAFF